MKILHFTYKLKPKPNPDLEWVDVNLIFESQQGFFDFLCCDYRRANVVKDIKEYEAAIEALDAAKAASLLETSDILDSKTVNKLFKPYTYQYRQYITWMPASQGILQQIRMLQQGFNNSRTTDDYLLYQCIEALDHFWD